jgi:aryl-alcohol dehydrogenase-like predicted oxidoreductase
MRRRQFLGITASALAANARALADAPMPMATLGKSGLKVSKFCLGGAHMAMRGEENALQIIRRALELGVTFFDCAAKYHGGKSDEIYGKAISPAQRKSILLMSKAEKRDRDGALGQLEMTLKRMNTNYLDLWQCHEVSTMAEVDQILGPNGALEAFVKAKKDGKVRHIGFTGHRDPAVHQRLLDAFDGWETVQHPVNCIDPHYLSFVSNVLPRVRAKGLGMIAMKSNAMGGIGKASIAKIEECLRFSWTQDVDTLVSGVETVEQLEQNVAVCKTFQPMSKTEISSLLERTSKGPIGSKVERYKRPEAGARTRPHNDGEPA